jgi:hypothetical protein
MRRTFRTAFAASLLTFLLLALLAAPASASKPLPVGITLDPGAPRVCVWTDPGDDIGTLTCVDPTNPDCLVYTVYETIAGPLFVCHVPAP